MHLVILRRMIYGLLAVLCLCYVVSCAAIKIDDSKTLKILFIGNSYTYTHDMPCIFEKIAKLKGKNVMVESNTQGGFCLREHCDREDMFEAIRSQKWDYVIIQGYSREFIFDKEKIDNDSKPYINQIIDSVKQTNDKAKFLFYMTWAYKNGYKELPEADSYEKMLGRITQGYDYIGKDFNIPIVPVGLIWQAIDQDDKMNLYQHDRAHPSQEGSYAAACTFFASIFNEPVSGVRTKELRKKKESYIQQKVDEYFGFNDVK